MLAKWPVSPHLKHSTVFMSLLRPPMPPALLLEFMSYGLPCIVLMLFISIGLRLTSKPCMAAPRSRGPNASSAVSGLWVWTGELERDVVDGGVALMCPMRQSGPQGQKPAM